MDVWKCSRSQKPCHSKLLMQTNLSEIFSETVKLLQLVLTFPMTTVEAERTMSALYHGLSIFCETRWRKTDLTHLL
jgi:hypothetical protein